MVRASNPNPKRMAELVMADWAKVGVKANPVTFEWADYQKRAKAGELTAGIFGWSGDTVIRITSFLRYLQVLTLATQTLRVSKMQNLMPY